jgi:hypothetical protein
VPFRLEASKYRVGEKSGRMFLYQAGFPLSRK